MKILIICNFSSGLYTFRGQLIKKLISEKHTVIAIVPKTSDENELTAESNLESLGCSLRHLSMERRGMNLVKDIKLLLNYAGALISEKPDLVITYTIKPNIYGSIACNIVNLFKSSKIKYAVNITGLGTAFENEGFLKTFVCVLYRLALKKASVVFFENSENRQTMLDLKLLKEYQTKVLAGAGVDLEYFQYTEYPTDTEQIRFLFIGRVMQEKGIDELFEAMKRLVKEGINCRLDVVGGFEEDYSQKLRQYTEEGWLFYYGYQNDVRPFIQNCHCFVLPSWHEGMANTNLESASMGRPIITTNISGCKEAVIDGVSGLLCAPRDSDSLFEKMVSFSKQPYEKQKMMGLCGREHMEKHFDKKMVVDITKNELYRKCKEK